MEWGAQNVSKIPPSVRCSPTFVPSAKKMSPPFFQPPPPVFPSCTSPDHGIHITKMISLIAFRQILPTIWPVACIFGMKIMTYLKKLIEIKSLNSIQNCVQQDYVPKL